MVENIKMRQEQAPALHQIEKQITGLMQKIVVGADSISSRKRSKRIKCLRGAAV